MVPVIISNEFVCPSIGPSFDVPQLMGSVVLVPRESEPVDFLGAGEVGFPKFLIVTSSFCWTLGAGMEGGATGVLEALGSGRAGCFEPGTGATEASDGLVPGVGCEWFAGGWLVGAEAKGW